MKITKIRKMFMRKHIMMINVYVFITRVNYTARTPVPVKAKIGPVYRSNRSVYRAHEFIGSVLRWEPDRFVYRAGPVPTGFANPVHYMLKKCLLIE
jgi:hypothetical protein